MTERHHHKNLRNIYSNMLTLATGAGLSKLVALLSIPIITRIYSPEDFGALSVFIAMTALLVPFGSLSYYLTIPLLKNDALALNLAFSSFIFLVLVSISSVFFLWYAAEPVMNLLSMQTLVPYWWLLPLAIFFTGLYELLNSWATREKSFKAIAKSNFLQSVAGAIVKVSMGFLGFKLFGLLLGQVISQSAGTIILIKIINGKFKTYKHKINRQRILFLLRRYSDYPKYRLPSQFLLVFSVQAPLLFSAWLFGAEVTGQLGLALMTLALPIILFGSTAGQSYYGEIAKIGRKHPEKIYNITKKVTIKMLFVSIAPFFILLLTGPFIFQLVFGDEWRQAGLFASILVIYLVFQFISSPVVKALDIFEKQTVFLRLNLIRSVAIIITFLLASWFSLDVVQTLYIYSIGLGLHYLLTILTVFSVIRNVKLEYK